MLRTPEITVSTSVGSDTSWGGCGHGHAMAGGERFSGKVVGLAREGGGAREEGKSTQELTAGAVVASASSGTSSVLRIERRRSPAVAMKMAVMAWLQGTRRRVRRGRASRIQGGARGLTGWAWGCWWLRWRSSAVSMHPGMSEGERQKRERGCSE